MLRGCVVHAFFLSKPDILSPMQSPPFCGRRRLRKAAKGTPDMFDSAKSGPLEPDRDQAARDFANEQWAQDREGFERIPQPQVI